MSFSSGQAVQLAHVAEKHLEVLDAAAFLWKEYTGNYLECDIPSLTSN